MQKLQRREIIMNEQSLMFFLIDSLAEYESKLKKLYETFAERFAESRDLWTWLAEEEGHHEEWIATAKDIIGMYKISTKADVTEMKYLENAITELEKYQQSATSNEISETGALVVAFKIENSILECDTLKILNCDIPEVCEYYKDIMRETKNHRDMVNERINKKSFDTQTLE